MFDDHLDKKPTPTRQQKRPIWSNGHIRTFPKGGPYEFSLDAFPSQARDQCFTRLAKMRRNTVTYWTTADFANRETCSFIRLNDAFRKTLLQEAKKKIRKLTDHGKQWWFYNTRNDTGYYVTVDNLSPKIKAVCVDQDFRECNSDRLYMNVNFTDRWKNVLNDHTRDCFFRKQGVFRNLWPLYKHSRQKWYLQYTDGGLWVVSLAYSPSDSNDKTILMRIKDFALRPEYISKTWSVHYNGWRDMPKLRVLCTGVNSMWNTCLSKPCDSKATCIYTSCYETLCVCPSGYTGVTCSTNKQCPTPYPLAGTELNFAYFGKRPGDLGFSFCNGLYPSVMFALCVESTYRVNPYWSRQGSACRTWNTGSTSSPRTPWNTQTTERSWTPWSPRTPWKPPTPRARRVNFDGNSVISPVVLTSAVILELLLPFIIYCCVVCKKKSKEEREEQEDQRRFQEVGGGGGIRKETRASC